MVLGSLQPMTYNIKQTIRIRRTGWSITDNVCYILVIPVPVPKYNLKIGGMKMVMLNVETEPTVN